MNLLEVKRASAAIQPNHSILIYGPPKSGKTLLVGTAAKIPEIQKIYWFDNENGAETLMYMGLTDEELAKITLYKMVDLRDSPISIETTLKAFTSKTPVNICDMHGRVDCAECLKAGNPSTPFCLAHATHNDLVVLDSGSQLGVSALNGACLGKPVTYKPGFDEYGTAGKWLGDICAVIQQCRNTNFVVLTHEIGIEEELNGVKKDIVYPLMGTKNFSRLCAKYFGTVVYTYRKLGKHAAGSSSLFRNDLMTGSRLNIALEKSSEPTMRDILVKGGILKSDTVESVSQEQTSEVKPLQRPLTLAEKIAASKAASK